MQKMRGIRFRYVWLHGIRLGYIMLPCFNSFIKSFYQLHRKNNAFKQINIFYNKLYVLNIKTHSKYSLKVHK